MFSLRDQIAAVVKDVVLVDLRLDDLLFITEELYLRELLTKHKGNQFKAAAFAELHRNTLSRKCHLHGLDAKSFRPRRKI